MKQLSQYFVVVGETKEFAVCEVPLEHHSFWRFVIAWDDDHDERIVPLLEHWIARGWVQGEGIRVVGETKGIVFLDRKPLDSDFHMRRWSLEDDVWAVDAYPRQDWDDVIRLFSCGKVEYPARVRVIA
jgi:hypothetical protein